ncbi:hypothetical protein TWF730_006001 [Orbilia blumenaviensis]|uniref:Uncharacterized protein n=1 Tax=Orbilia blumenaviensis TaxID=1796055 RepID=A0AAV9VK18_9PEZI
MLSSKVAMVEDFNSEVQEVVPSSRIQAFKKRQSGLASVTNYSDAGTVDSGYSSTSAPNGQEEHELFPESDSPSRHTPQSDLSDSNISERTPVNRPVGLESEVRSSRSSNAHRTSGKYAFVSGLGRNIERIERPLSRSTSKRDSTGGRASPAIRPQDADECDCPQCAKASSSAQPSPSLPPPDAGLDGNWLDMSNSLPSYNFNSLDYSSGLLSGSPGRSRGAARENNGFIETFPTPGSNASGNARPSSLLSNTNPLGGLSTSYEYSASPSTYTPHSGVNPLLSPPPYTGDEWPQPGLVQPTTPTRNRDHVEDYLNYPNNDYLYGNGSGALSASGGNHTNYDLPPRSASVQPPGLRNRPRSSTYHVDYAVGTMGPPQRRPSKAPAPKRIHSATNSYDAGRYDTPVPYSSYDSYDNTTAEEFHSPSHHPISRRLSRAGTGALPPLDITRATSVPPVDNYVAGIERARRMTSVTPQPLQITNRDRNRRGSNASSGLSSSASRRAHEARMSMAEMIDSVKVEPRPELALAKRDSTGVAMVKHGYSPAEFEYATEGAYAYDYPYDTSANHFPDMGYRQSYIMLAGIPCIGPYV